MLLELGWGRPCEEVKSKCKGPEAEACPAWLKDAGSRGAVGAASRGVTFWWRRDVGAGRVLGGVRWGQLGMHLEDLQDCWG